MSVTTDKEYCDYEIEDIQYPEGSVVLVFDLDTVIYPTASAQDKTSIIVKGRTEDRSYKNRTEFKKVCEKNNWNYEIFTIEDSVSSQPVHICYSVFKKTIEKYIKELSATHCEYYLGGSENFRDTLPLPVKYKSNRKESRKPTHLAALQSYALKSYPAKKIKGMECDDLVSIRMLEVNKQKNVKAILITTDKDSLQSFTSEGYVYKQGCLYHLNSALGELHIDSSKKVKGTGLKWLLTQALIVGDPTDEYLPRRHFKTSYGEKSWYKDVKDIEDVSTFLKFAIDKFIELVGQSTTYTDYTGTEQNLTWLELAEIYWACAYMKTKVRDTMKFEDLLKQYDVSYTVEKLN